MSGSDRENSQWCIFPAQNQGNNRFHTGSQHSIAFLFVGFVGNVHRREFFFEDSLSPGLARRNLFFLRKICFVEAHCCAHHEFRRASFSFKEPHDSVRNPKTANDVNEHEIQDFANRKGLGARSGKQTQTAKLVI